MSLHLIESEIRRFLNSREPEVICISGHWGVGKTFAWNHYLKDAKSRGEVALKHYSYVSLFGINSLDELKYSVFENSVSSSDIGIEPNFETIQSNTIAATKRFGKQSLGFLQQLPIVKNYVGGIGPLWFLSVNETIICIDDIERRGDKLSIRDVLGFVSSLKERKRCKVFLILNDEALDESKKEFLTYFEKVVDASLKFAPSPNECARIALPADTATSKQLADNCEKLGISNIRLIKKIERAVNQIERSLNGFDERVLKQAIQSLVLLGWSIYEPTRAPSLDYLNRRAESFLGVIKGEAVPPNEASWNALLDAYGFKRHGRFRPRSTSFLTV